jgi:hypothetical protein
MFIPAASSKTSGFVEGTDGSQRSFGCGGDGIVVPIMLMPLAMNSRRWLMPCTLSIPACIASLENRLHGLLHRQPEHSAVYVFHAGVQSDWDIFLVPIPIFDPQRIFAQEGTCQVSFWLLQSKSYQFSTYLVAQVPCTALFPDSEWLYQRDVDNPGYALSLQCMPAWCHAGRDGWGDIGVGGNGW